LKSVSPCSLEEIRGLLDKDTAILEYFSGEKDLILWIITQDSMFTKIIPAGSEDLKEKITSYREQIATHMTVEKIRSTEWKNTASELYTILIDDTNKLLEDKKRLIIIPHKSLHYLPFNTLLDSSGKYLMEKYEIIYLPSASTLSYCKKKNTHKKESLIAFEYGNFNRPPYAPLPDSITEVKAIREIYPQNKVFKGKEITIDAIETDSKNKDLIHFAMHGILDSRAPMFSKLILPEEDLEVYKIFNMKLNASLVTLSACSTGLGKLSKGDELIGFSRAFIYAGTPTVCVSLWDVSDKVTSEFMKRFYLHLKENNSKSQALRLAQMDIIDKYPHPFFWAPFVLIGDWN
jgi:CHAT domain-containing protein